MKLAAIDIGSNSIHLVIVDAVPGQHPQLVDREKEMVRLGAGTLQEQKLSKETIERGLITLRRFKKIAESNKAELIISTATSAVREARNADDFVERVRREVGLDVKVLPGVEEARLIALAVTEVTEFDGRRALIVDIGGGSTEFIVTDGGEPDLLLSVQVGAVRLTERFVSTDPLSAKERDKLVATIRTDLTRAAWEVKSAGFDFVIGTSGTILNMADAIVQADSPNATHVRSGIEPFSETVTLEQICRMNRKLCKMSLKQRARLPGIEKRRADIIPAGGLLLECIMSELGAERIRTCDWSLREGVILNYLRSHDARRAAPATSQASDTALFDVNPDDSLLDVRARSIMSVARRYSYDAPHSHHVARLAARIFDDTLELHEMGEGERRLLLYAALLHDIGYHIAHNNHDRHAAYLIKNSEMPGFTGADIAMMTALVRYHRGSMPRRGGGSRARREHEDYYALDPSQRSSALGLAAVLQIADGLDRSHRQNVLNVTSKTSRKGLTFIIECEAEADLEMWSAQRKAILFADVFDLPVRFERAKPTAGSIEAIAVAD